MASNGNDINSEHLENKNKDAFHSKMLFFQDEWMKLKKQKDDQQSSQLNNTKNELKILSESMNKKVNDLKGNMRSESEGLKKEIYNLKEYIDEMKKDIIKKIAKIEVKIKEDDYNDEDIQPYSTSDIWDAAESGILPAVKYYIKNDPSCVNAINPKYPFRWAPIHCACEGGYLYIVKYLISQGADINSRTVEFEDTPLHTAAVNGQLNIIKYLLSLDTSCINVNNARKNTPLHLAASGGFLKCCKHLIDHGADPNLTNIDSQTPLYFAKYNNHKDLIEYLESLILTESSQ